VTENMAKIFRGSGFELDSSLLKELYEQKAVDEMRPHNWEIDSRPWSKAIRSVRREINGIYHGTNGKILKERKNLAIEKGKAFESPAYVDCNGHHLCGPNDHSDKEVSVAIDKRHTPYRTIYYCGICTERFLRSYLEDEIEELRNWRRNPHGVDESDLKWRTAAREGNVESAKKNLDDYLAASEKQKYYYSMREVGYKCPHSDCNLVVKGRPISYSPDDGKFKSICGVCEREL